MAKECLTIDNRDISEKSSLRNREFVEGFENSSFTRPSGGEFEVKLAQNSKNEKVVCGSLLEFHRHRISSLIKMD